MNIFYKYKDYLLFLFIVLVFLTIRFINIDTPYHQDEYKWPLYAEKIVYKPGSVPHPPLTEFIYQKTGDIFGLDSFRITPLIFSLCNLFLLFIVSKRRYGKKNAFIISSIFAISFFSVLSSLMIDTDGAILPFFFLLSLWFYDSFKLEKNKSINLFLMIVSIVLGILVKMSFVLVIIAIFIDFILDKKENIDKKSLLKYLSLILGFSFFVLILLFVAQYVFDGFSLIKGFKYWETFMKGFSDRNFLQTSIQFIKAVFYLSPFLFFGFLISIFIKAKEVRIFYIFIISGLIFYLILFDFSIGALDRYLSFLVIPLSVITGLLFSKIMSDYNNKINKKYLLSFFIVIIFIFLFQFIYHYTPPLHPKIEWISRALSFKWNFLYTFSGGSGPLPFYISFGFIAFSYIFGTLLSISFIFLKDKRREILIGLIFLGLVYNLTFIEEFTFGFINGSSKKMAKEGINFIRDNKDIKNVLVYNDNGGWEIRRMGKYTRRIYAVPEFEKSYKQIFSEFHGHILSLDIPKVSENNFYNLYLKKCKNIYSNKDKYISLNIYECLK